MMKNLYKKNLIWFTAFIIFSISLSCALSRNFQENDFTEKCTHCHGEKLQGINNAKAYCGECHEITKPLSPENIADEDRKQALLSEPHIHKIKNVFAGTPSCFYCHRKGSF